MNETSEKQIEANRENGKKGGVKTDEGKAVSKYNAIKHGLLSKEVLVEGEDARALKEFEADIREKFAPEGPLEAILVDRIISCFWRLRRAVELERNAMEWSREHEITRIHFETTTEEQMTRAAIKKMINNDTVEKVLRYETTIERSIFKTLHELERLQASRNGEMVPLPTALDVHVFGEKENGFVS